MANPDRPFELSPIFKLIANGEKADPPPEKKDDQVRNQDQTQNQLQAQKTDQTQTQGAPAANESGSCVVS